MIAAAFAVAFAVLMSTAEAEVHTKTGETFATDGAGDATNGDVRYITHSSPTGYVRFTIETTGSASASFTHSDASDDGQSILCQAEPVATETGTCDARPGFTGVTVAVKIDNDSGKGIVFVNQKVVTGEGMPAETADSIDIEVAQVPTTLSAKLAATSINSGQGTGQTPGRTLLDIRLTDENGAGIADKAITVVSTRALLSTPITDAAPAGDGTGSLMRRIGGTENNTVGGDLLTLDSFRDDDDAVLAGTVDTTQDADVTTNATNPIGDIDSRGYARVAVAGGGCRRHLHDHCYAWRVGHGRSTSSCTARSTRSRPRRSSPRSRSAARRSSS